MLSETCQVLGCLGLEQNETDKKRYREENKTDKLRVFWVSEVGETDNWIFGCNRGWDMEYNGNDFGMEWNRTD